MPKLADLETRGGCWFENDYVTLHLAVEADFRPSRKAHPVLLVTDFSTLVSALRHPSVEVGQTHRGRATARSTQTTRSAVASS